MVSTVIIILLLIAGIAVIAKGKIYYTEEKEGGYGREATVTQKEVKIRWIGAILVILALLFSLFSMTTIVQAKNVGVLTTFGKVSDRTLPAGLHLKAPWQKVVSIDATIQPDEYKGDNCIYVRIGDGSSACLSLTNRWRVSADEANVVYADYRDSELDPTSKFRASVVSTQLKFAANKVFGAYNPVADLKALSGDSPATDINFAPDLTSYGEQIKAELEARTGGLATIEDVTVSYIKLSASTQDRLDAFIAEVGKTRIAAQKKETAAQEAAANDVLSASISNDPNVLVSKCLDMMTDAQESGYQLPAGFSCWPGNSGAVVVPSTK